MYMNRRSCGDLSTQFYIRASGRTVQLSVCQPCSLPFSSEKDNFDNFVRIITIQLKFNNYNSTYGTVTEYVSMHYNLHIYTVLITVHITVLLYIWRLIIGVRESSFNMRRGDVVSFASVIRVVTHRSSPLTAAHLSSTFLSPNWPIRSRPPYTGNLVFGCKCKNKYDWRAADKYMHVIGSQ